MKDWSRTHSRLYCQMPPSSRPEAETAAGSWNLAAAKKRSRRGSWKRPSAAPAPNRRGAGFRGRAVDGADGDGSPSAPPEEAVFEDDGLRRAGPEGERDLDRPVPDARPEPDPGRSRRRAGDGDPAQETRRPVVGAVEKLRDAASPAAPGDFDARRDASREPAGPDGASACGVDRAAVEERDGRRGEPLLRVERQRGPLGAEALGVHHRQTDGGRALRRRDLDGRLDAAVAEEEIIDAVERWSCRRRVRGRDRRRRNVRGLPCRRLYEEDGTESKPSAGGAGSGLGRAAKQPGRQRDDRP